METRKSGLDAAFVERQRQQLLRLRGDLVQVTQAAESDEADVRSQRSTGVIEREEDAQQLDSLERNENLVGHEIDRLARVDRALAKIEEGSYGLSDMSGKPIPRERLEAVPDALLTLGEEQSLEA